MTEDVNKNKEQQEEVDTTVATETSTEGAEVEETVETEETVAETEEASEEVEETEETTEEEESIEESVPTFTGEVDGKTYTFDQLQAASEDYTDEEFHELAGMYENTLSEIEEKEIVTGIVVSVDEKYVIVDIGFKSEGIVQANEFSDKVLENLAPGDEVEVFLDKVEDREGQLILSRKKADILQAWENLENSYETGEVIEGYIQRRIKGGMVVDVFGIDAFLPGSQIDVRPVRDFDAYVGKTMEFQVVKLNMQAENVVVSHRALIESDLEDQRQEILETIEAGQVLEGIVKNITDFGVFIDLGGVDGLLHITDLSWGRVEHPEEIVKLDQRMNVAVIDFDEESKRVSLGLKQLQPHPWDEIYEKYPENMRVQGRVVSIADYGAFIELEKGVEGLIHISEMSWTQHIKHPSQLVQKDDIIECVVLNINEDEKKISLGVKQLEKDPWEDLLDRYPIGSSHKGEVRNLTNFGVFVELEPGIDGLIHVSDLSWTEKVEHPNEVVDKGQEIEVVILAVDFDNRRITLGHKQVQENPWEKYAEEYGIGSKVEGEISKITDKGMFVKMDLGVDAFLAGSKLKESVEDLKENFSEGDKIEGYVVEFDESSKTIELSQDEDDVKKRKPKSKKSPQKSEDIETGTPTLGEVSGLADKLAEKEKNSEN
ncbi:30S ribosomal protein S1 [Rhodohalobacter sulfatireducens]|uniref:Small ribosomal subunit protein bS1 n=1 Tax=Rhodohalobacter sulfatireducens TaxID=2911366 RepID=A0ABS9KBU2_9BACT|nr:30S ribosomal protein S1 [Rhodohalobacter sulfatireducens]MCG2588324.1 30S ribosomal protein S1 [Rhodohalobacter sulfatireducens]